MKSFSFMLVLALVSAMAVAQQLPSGHPPTATKSEGKSVPEAQPLPSGHPPMATKSEGKSAPEAQLPQKAKVLSTIDAAQYTYIEVTQNKKTLWLAATKVAVKKGDVIRYDNGMEMTNFNSKTLNRTFPSVFFVNSVVVTKEKE